MGNHTTDKTKFCCEVNIHMRALYAKYYMDINIYVYKICLSLRDEVYLGHMISSRPTRALFHKITNQLFTLHLSNCIFWQSDMSFCSTIFSAHLTLHLANCCGLLQKCFTKQLIIFAFLSYHFLLCNAK